MQIALSFKSFVPLLNLVNARWISSIYADRAQTMQKVCRYDQKQKKLVVVHKLDH